MSQKLEFVRLALLEGANVSALCRRFGIGRSLGYKLLRRYRGEGEAGLAARSRRPSRSPRHSGAEVEAAALSIRAAHPAWGGRKIAAVIARDGLGQPAPSTVTGILRRNGIRLGGFGGGAKPFVRFEHEAPNELWQMDFKGHVALATGRLHPLTVLDDHSRFALLVEACPDQTAATVKTRLINGFRRYGKPWRIAVDNGPPWGDGGSGEGFTRFTVWLIEHDIAVTHSRPRHPQTLGKAERFHRSLKAEALAGPPFADLARAQARLDAWRQVYNAERPHQALGGAVPITRYRPSPRDFTDAVQPFDHPHPCLVRKVCDKGRASLMARSVAVGKAFAGKNVAFLPAAKDGVFDVLFRHQVIRSIDLNAS